MQPPYLFVKLDGKRCCQLVDLCFRQVDGQSLCILHKFYGAMARHGDAFHLAALVLAGCSERLDGASLRLGIAQGESKDGVAPLNEADVGC